MSDELREFVKNYNNNQKKCHYCNGTGQKSFGKLGIRSCVHCKGTGRI